MRKTLDALAGGDDKIYVILDDREDVWLEDDGRPYGLYQTEGARG